MADYANITLERDGAVRGWCSTGPERRNALTHAMMLELEDAFAAVRDDRSCRVLVLRGAGGHFCAGGDLDAMADMPPEPANGAADPLVPAYRQFGDALLALNRSAAGDDRHRRGLGGGRRLRHGLLLRRGDPARQRALRHAGAQGGLHSLADHPVRGAPHRRGRGARSRRHRPGDRRGGGPSPGHRPPSLRHHGRHQPDLAGGDRRYPEAGTAGAGHRQTSGAVLRHGG